MGTPVLSRIGYAQQCLLSQKKLGFVSLPEPLQCQWLPVLETQKFHSAKACEKYGFSNLVASV